MSSGDLPIRQYLHSVQRRHLLGHVWSECVIDLSVMSSWNLLGHVWSEYVIDVSAVSIGYVFRCWRFAVLLLDLLVRCRVHIFVLLADGLVNVHLGPVLDDRPLCDVLGEALVHGCSVHSSTQLGQRH